MNMELLMARAVERAKVREVGTRFTVKGLFDGEEWNGIDAYVRRKLDIRFRSYVNDHPECGVAFIAKRANNGSEYLRVED